MPTIEPKKGAPTARTKSEPRFDKVLMGPGEYEITKDSTFTITLPLAKKPDEKWWVIVKEEDADTVEKVVFRMWTYDEMVELRKLATKYDQIRRVHMIDHDTLNRLKIQRYMLSWTFEKANQRMELHHVGGVLSDETWDKVRRLQTNLLKYIMEQMNERYEYGG